jgi:tripartite-type tricarboxylate transporter receptor subunit TctC
MRPKRWMHAVAVAMIAFASNAAAQGWPTRPVRVVVPYGPGTGVDVVVRALNEVLSKNLGQNFVTENRAGAAGTVAAQYVLGQGADGHTVLSDSSSHTIVPALMDKVPYDTLRDFSGVTTLIDNPLVLVTSKASGFTSVADLVAAARTRPGALTYGSAGSGSSTHVSFEKLRVGAGIDMLHVPFKSTTDALVEVMAGRIDVTWTALASAQSAIREGRLVALAASRRVSVLSNVPSADEVVPGSGYSSWIGLMVPSKTPRDVVLRLNQEVVRAMNSPEMKERLAKLGAEPWTMTADEFDALRRREVVDNERLVKAAGIRAQ